MTDGLQKVLIPNVEPTRVDARSDKISPHRVGALLGKSGVGGTVFDVVGAILNFQMNQRIALQILNHPVERRVTSRGDISGIKIIVNGVRRHFIGLLEYGYDLFCRGSPTTTIGAIGVTSQQNRRERSGNEQDLDFHGRICAFRWPRRLLNAQR